MRRVGIWLWLTLCLLPSAGPVSASSVDYQEHWLRIAEDHLQDNLFARVLLGSRGEIFVRRLDLLTLNIPVPDKRGFRHDGERFHAAATLPTHDVHVDLRGGHVHFIRRNGQSSFTDEGVLLLDIILPDEDPVGPVRVVERAGELLLPAKALADLRIDGSGLPQTGEHVPVAALVGNNYVVNPRTLALWMTIPPERRSLRRIHLRSREAAGPAQPGGISASLDYDLSGGINEQTDAWRAALLGGGVGFGFARCESRALRAQDTSRWRRLESHCRYDWSDALMTLEVGDAISRQDSLGQPVRYAGVKIGTDFSLAPAMTTQPDLLLRGTSRVPSTLELWVNQTLAGRKSVGSGPFIIEDIPALTGAGELRLVVEDALGGRETFYRPYYSAPHLLRPGLADWSLEAGRLRENFAFGDDQYTDHLAVAGSRLGVTDWLTLHGRGEYLEDTFHGLGGGAVFQLWRLGQMELGAMVSRDSNAVEGGMWRAGFSRRGRLVSLGVRHARSDRHFRQLGFRQPGDAPASQSQANIGLRIAGNVSASVAAFQRDDHDGSSLRLYTAGLSLSVLQRGQLHLSATLPERPEGDRFYSLTFTLPLGKRTSGSAGLGLSGEDPARSLSVQRNLPAGRGLGYRLGVAQTGDSRISEAELQGQNDLARLALSARDTNAGSSGFARLSGSLLATSAGIGGTRESGTAATVVLPTAGVRIYHDNQPVAVSNARGRAVISGLRPYEANRLRLEHDDLPIHATLAKSELTLVPARGQVVEAGFDVRLDRHISARLLTADGDPVPAGASVWVDGERQSAGLGYRGQLYIRTDQMSELLLEVVWQDRRCEIHLPAAEASAVIQDLGERTCR